MRNDYKLIQDSSSGQEPHRFLGTVNSSPAAGIVNPSPSDQIKVLDSAAKPKTFVNQVRGADFLILDISQFNCNLEEADLVLRSLKYADTAAEKDQTLIVVSSPMSWSQTPQKENSTAYGDTDFHRRIPLPKYLILK